MTFIAMNRFKVKPGHEAAFETVWKSRESRLKELKGFREFRLLRGPEGEGYRLYSSHVIWDSRADFEAWTKSEQFRDAHRNAGQSSTRDALMGPPSFEGFETVLEEV
ncbi:antibiotic biosynthesis monooxygenase family protein [Pseudooceanicola nanhaiensis]|uniref:antibiotic biosynthesis monooxygenase family protein n=1 Tax=Pseudooceanicola nanhaiensis TaxID=375761 RepID=UPI001CD1AA93|nr:antibiotic biosynthesis monooxygenase [Pseudooceanicola nanhaiensis]MCA0918901.1 antibiotic biosynthesis monooxygenase [Pseudooceanicola nanhaiensis]